MLPACVAPVSPVEVLAKDLTGRESVYLLGTRFALANFPRCFWAQLPTLPFSCLLGAEAKSQGWASHALA